MAYKLRRQIARKIVVLKRGEISKDNFKMLRGDKAVLMCLALRAAEDGSAIFCGIAHIIEETGYTRTWIQKCLRRLESKGFLIPVSLVGGRGNKTNYHIPLDQFGMLAPKPATPRLELQEQQQQTRASPGAAPSPEEELDLDLDGDSPAVPPERLSVATSQALTLVSPPEPEEEELEEELQQIYASEQQIELWMQRVEQLIEIRNQFIAGGKAWNKWNMQVEDAQENVRFWQDQHERFLLPHTTTTIEGEYVT